MAEAIYKMGDLTRQITMNITITQFKRWQLRFWLGTQIMKLAAKIMQVNIDIEIRKPLY